MKIKNISPVERHVEKLVFAVAAAASLYLVWNSLSNPATVDDKVANGGPVSAREVENKVESALKKLRDAQAKTNGIIASINKTGDNYIERYVLSQKEPLPKSLLSQVPLFAPLQYQPKAVDGPANSIQKSRLATVPVVPAPTDLTLTASRNVVLIPVQGAAPAATPVNPVAPANPASAVNTETRDMNWVTVEAHYPMAELIRAMQAANLPNMLQRPTFIAVNVQRLDVTAGSGNWEDVAPTSAVQVIIPDFNGVADDKIPNVLDYFDQHITDILTPAFYQNAPVVVSTTPTPPVARQPQQPPQPQRPEFSPEDMPFDPAHPNRPGAGGMRNRPGMATRTGNQPAVRQPVRTTPTTPQPQPQPMPPDMTMVNPEMAANPAAVQQTDLRAQDQVTIRFYDEHVMPDHEYSYRMRVTIYNPLYRLQIPIKSDDPKITEKSSISSAWTEAKETGSDRLASIKIDPNMFLFVSRPISSGTEVAQFSIYKWDNGMWQKSDETLMPGQTIGRQRQISNQKSVDFSTGYMLVDVRNEGDLVAILQDPSGKLIVRNASVDASNPKRLDLESKVAPKPRIVAPAAANAAGAM